MWHAAIHLLLHGNLKRREAYLPCLTAGAPCDDRHGNASGEVSEEGAALAAEQLAATRAARGGRSHRPGSSRSGGYGAGDPGAREGRSSSRSPCPRYNLRLNTRRFAVGMRSASQVAAAPPS